MSLMDYCETPTGRNPKQIKARRERLNALAFIRATVPPCELWAQLAEEATELAHAALKLRRATGVDNPTPVEPGDAFGQVMEEIADVTLLIHVLQLDTTPDALRAGMDYKLLRWRGRLEGKEEKESIET